jgi:general secretion pathway protein D
VRNAATVRVSSAAALAMTIAVAGCGQSLPELSSNGPVQTGRVFDWVDSTPSMKEPAKKRGDNSSSDEIKNAEIYYGGGGVVEKQGQLPPAKASGPGGSELLIRTNGKGSAKGVTRTDDGVSLNFENAEIKSVVRAIVGDMFNMNYAIDPGISGTISLSTRRPIQRAQVLAVLETALRSRGAIMVQRDGFVRIVADKDAAGSGEANVGRDAGAGGYGITALPLQNISADALSKILDGFGAPPESVRVDAERNLLIVRGSSGERQQLVDTALAFDVDWMRDQTVGIFPVRNGSPDAIIAEMSKVTASTPISYQPIERMNAILAVAKSADAIQQASNWIARLDRTSDAGVRVRVYRLKHADARRVAGVVRDMFGTGGNQAQLGIDAGLLAPKSDKTGARAAPTKVALANGVLDAPRSDAAGPGESPGLEGGSATTIRIAADVANNAIVVHARQEDAILVERAIRDLDRAQVQVAIEATIAEITLNDKLNNGVQFYLRGKWGAISQSLDNPPLGRVFPGVNLVLGNEASPRLVLDVLREITEVKILSSPSLVVVDNQPAVLQVGDQVPITTRSAQSVSDPLAPIVNSVDFRDTGVILRIVPQVHANSMVTIDVDQEISSVKDVNGQTETLTPTISQRRVKSTVSVADGHTLLLAGLINEQKSKGKSGLPGLIEIPVLGNILASRSSDEKTRTELIIFIKPQVIRSTGDARRVAEGLRKRLKGFERW